MSELAPKTPEQIRHEFWLEQRANLEPYLLEHQNTTYEDFLDPEIPEGHRMGVPAQLEMLGAPVDADHYEDIMSRNPAFSEFYSSEEEE